MNKSKFPLIFFVLVFALSTPLSLAGTVVKLEVMPGVPISAIAVTFCPLIAALILVYRENKTAGIIELLKRAFDFKRIKAKVWHAPLILIMPGVMTLEYLLLRSMGSPIPLPQFSIWAPLVIFITTFIAALGEELGWMGYAFGPMQERSNAFSAAILLGVVWAVWHLIPVIQEGRSAMWIAWWALATVAQRVIIVWLYNNTGKSVFVAAFYHAMMNVTWQLFPINGSFYDPRITGLIVAVTALFVIVVWDPRTLTQYRFARSS
jgi:membrane protease YdiL (CAAX protease family)